MSSTQKHSDAIGHLNDLAKDVKQPWFNMICELATIGNSSTLDGETKEVLSALFREQASYLGIRPQPVSLIPPATTSRPDFLEKLTGFSDFKSLQDTLEVRFKNRITIIFGTNGSGKSSLCESLKTLGSSEAPNRPLRNVRKAKPGNPKFRFKFTSDQTELEWTEAAGYGARKNVVKYFDAGTAIANVKDPVEPERIIVLTPFKLHVFEWVKELTTAFKTHLLQEKQNNTTNLINALARIRTTFSGFSSRPLALIDDKTLSCLDGEIKVGGIFTQTDLLKQNQAKATDLEKATSDEGLTLLKAEHRELGSFLVSLEGFLENIVKLWALTPVAKSAELAKKQTAQAVLAERLVPKSGTLDDFMEMLRHADLICDFESSTGQPCPLCKRDMKESEVELFKQYHKLISNELNAEINELQKDIKSAEALEANIKKTDCKSWASYETIPSQKIQDAQTGAKSLIDVIGITKDPDPMARKTLESLKGLATDLNGVQTQKEDSIESANTGKQELVKQLRHLHAEIEPLAYAQLVSDHLPELRATQDMVIESKYWDGKLPQFTPLFKKITDFLKGAHEDLIVADFEKLLNEEYIRLSERPMVDFGVSISQRGTGATVKVLPQIGANDIRDVLSEGEQRLHALALFFAETRKCQQSVLVFDDPASSFDFNFIASYCERLRDLARHNKDCQIIVLTHNWEFFVQLQDTLNKVGMNNDCEVQVLENRATASAYSEEADKLHADIKGVLEMPTELTQDQKPNLAIKMRILIESICNVHVFHGHRHQYKQKTPPVSDFMAYTRIVPLLEEEAIKFKDIYSKLSVPEHADPRNYFMSTDKAAFKTRYDQILGVEAAILARKSN